MYDAALRITEIKSGTLPEWVKIAEMSPEMRIAAALIMPRTISHVRSVFTF